MSFGKHVALCSNCSEINTKAPTIKQYMTLYNNIMDFSTYIHIFIYLFINPLFTFVPILRIIDT